MDGDQEFLHRRTHVARFAPRVREQLHGGDVGVRVGDAARHQRSRIGLRLGHAAQPRHEIPQGDHVTGDPRHERHQQAHVEAAQHRHHGHEIDDDEHQQLADDEPGVAHGQRGLHDLGGDAAGELVLVEMHALAEHQAVEVPAQQHREIAEQRLLLDRRLQRDEQDAAGQHGAEQQEAVALLREEQRRFHGGEPVDDAAHHREQQRLERAYQRGEHDRGEQVRPQAQCARPQEREKPAGWRRGRGLRIGIDQTFEMLEQGESSGGATNRPVRPRSTRSCARRSPARVAAPAAGRRADSSA